MLHYSAFHDSEMLGQALFRSYGCFFAEFLEDLSLVRLGLLDLTTCVGLRYGFCIVILREFSWKLALHHFLHRSEEFSRCSELMMCGFSYTSSLQYERKSNNTRYILNSVLPSNNIEVMEY